MFQNVHNARWAVFFTSFAKRDYTENVLKLFLKETSLKRTTKGNFALSLGIRNN